MLAFFVRHTPTTMPRSSAMKICAARDSFFLFFIRSLRSIIIRSLYQYTIFHKFKQAPVGEICVFFSVISERNDRFGRLDLLFSSLMLHTASFIYLRNGNQGLPPGRNPSLQPPELWCSDALPSVISTVFSTYFLPSGTWTVSSTVSPAA